MKRPKSKPRTATHYINDFSHESAEFNWYRANRDGNRCQVWAFGGWNTSRYFNHTLDNSNLFTKV